MMFLLLIINFVLAVGITFHFLKTLNLNNGLKVIFAIAFSLQAISVLFYLSLVVRMRFEVFTLVWTAISLLSIISIGEKPIHYLPGRLRLSTIDLFALFFLAYGCSLLAHDSARWGAWDAWAIWNLHAKFMLTGGYWTNYLTNTISWTHPDYPLFLSSSVAIVWKSIGNGASAWVPASFTMLFFTLIILANHFSFSGKRPAWLVILVFLCLVSDAQFIKIASLQYADIALSLFYLLTFILLIDGIEFSIDDSIFYWIGLMASSCLWIKNEGFVFFLIVSCVVLVRYFRHPSSLVRYVIGSSPFSIVVLMFKLIYAPANDLVAGSGVNFYQKLFDIHRYITIAKFLGKIVFFQFPCLLFLAFALFILKKKEFLKPNMLVLYLVSACYFFVYVVTPKDLEWHLNTSGDRLIAQIYPAAIYVFFTIFQRHWALLETGLSE